MARGRMINRAICADKRMSKLSNDTSRLAFTWLISHLDREGRTYGDPAMVLSMVFPRRTDVTGEDMERYIQEWADIGLVVWYEAEDDLWIWFPAFHKNQKGLDRRKESESIIPPPPTDRLGTYQARTGYVPGTAEVNGIEGNGTDGDPPPLDAKFSHPAVKDYIRITTELPGKTQRELIETSIGYEDTGEGEAWEQTMRKWLNLGWKGTNVKGMVDRHLKGWDDIDRKRGSHPSGEPQLEAW